MMKRLFGLIFLLSVESGASDKVAILESSASSPRHQKSHDLTDPHLVWIVGTDDAIHLLNYKTQQEITKIKGSKSSDIMKITPDGRQLLVTTKGEPTIYFINTQTLEWEKESIEMRAEPIFIEITADGKQAAVIKTQDKGLSLINLQTRKIEREDILVGLGVLRLKITNDKKYALILRSWMPRKGEDVIQHRFSIYNFKTWKKVKEDIKIVRCPGKIHLAPDEKIAYVSYVGGGLSTINVNKWVIEKYMDKKILNFVVGRNQAFISGGTVKGFLVMNLKTRKCEKKDIQLEKYSSSIYQANEGKHALVTHYNHENPGSISIIDFRERIVTPWKLNFEYNNDEVNIVFPPLSTFHMRKNQQQITLLFLQRANQLTDIRILR